LFADFLIQDEEAYLGAFNERMDHADLDFWNTHDFCRRNADSKFKARCTRKRGEATTKRNNHTELHKRAEKLLKRNIFEPKIERRDDLDASNFCDMGSQAKRETQESNMLEKRNPVAIFVEIGVWAARMATSLLARAIPRLATFSPRLANLLKNSPNNLFRLAPKGTVGNAGSRETMKQAFRKLADSPAFKKCLRDGKP
jgi:hypothetical protein